MDNYLLPHGAKGIEGEDFAVEFRGNKVVFIVKTDCQSADGVKGTHTHYTLHIGPESGIIDVHETIEVGGQKKHRTLFAVRRDALPAVLEGFAPMLLDLLALRRPLRLGWLKHRNIGIARGIHPVTDEDFAAVTRKHKRRLVIDPQQYEQNVRVPEYLDEIYGFPDGNFVLLQRGRETGIGFKTTDADGTVCLCWIKHRDLRRYLNALQDKVTAAFRLVAIPPDRYSDYPFLQVK